MNVYPIDKAVRETWKTTPIRIGGPAASQCCALPTVLVQSMDGGFVTSNCWGCGKKDSLSRADFDRLSIWLACPRCLQPMTRGMVDQNYAFTCGACDIAVRLADVLPWWHELKARPA
jgi:hypothetical protein